MWGDESEAVAPIIWLYQIVDAQKEEVFFPDLLITLRSYDFILYLSPYKQVILKDLAWSHIPKLYHKLLNLIVHQTTNFIAPSTIILLDIPCVTIC